MPIDYESMIESLSPVLHHRLEAQERNRTLGLSCISMSEFCADSPATKYAYLLLAERSFDGELKEIPKVSDYGYIGGDLDMICSDCGSSYKASSESCRCRACAEKLLVLAVLQES